MNVHISYTAQFSAPFLQELDDIELLADVTDIDNRTVPKGAQGTVVAVWSQGRACEVEFSDPHALATVRIEQLRKLG